MSAAKRWPSPAQLLNDLLANPHAFTVGAFAVSAVALAIGGWLIARNVRHNEPGLKAPLAFVLALMIAAGGCVGAARLERVPFFYVAGPFAIVAAALFLFADRQRFVRDPQGKVVADRWEIALTFARFRWTRDKVNRHFFFTGDTGSGKTTGMNRLLDALMARNPRLGGVVMANKGDEWFYLEWLAKKHGRSADLIRLADERAVRKSLVFPFQFLSAVDVLKQGNLPGASRVMDALNQAIDHSLANVPNFGGNTLVALDSSGSMVGRPQTIGSLFAATLVKATGADLMLFSDDARYVTLNRRDTTLTAAQSIPFISGGTNFNAIFQRANRAYDRIVILSDMQGWIGAGAPVQPFADYKTRYSVTPRVFSFDLKGYGTLQFPQERVYCLAGWSDRVFEIMQKLDRDPEALVRDVESVPLAD